jgi:hypothetical protein
VSLQSVGCHFILTVSNAVTYLNMAAAFLECAGGDK